MKAPVKKIKKPRASHSQNHRRQLERLLKQILAGKISIQSVAEMSETFPKTSYRRMIE